MPTPLANPAAGHVIAQAIAHPGALTAAASAVRGGLPGLLQSAAASGVLPGTHEADRRKKVKAHDELEKGPGFLTRSLDKISLLGALFFNYQFFGQQLIPPVLGVIGKGFNAVGLKSVGGWFGRRVEGIERQAAFLEKTNVSEALTKTSEALSGKVTRTFGEENLVARGMNGVARAAQQAQGELNRGLGFVGARIGTQLGNAVAHFEPELEAAAVRNGMRAHRHLTTVRQSLNEAQTLLDTHGERLGVNVFDSDRRMLKATSTYIPEGSKATVGAKLTAQEHMANVRANFTKATRVLNGTPDAAQAQTAQRLVAQMRGDLEAVAALHEATPELSKAAGELRTALGKSYRPLGAVAARLESEAGWRALPENARNIGKAAGEMKVGRAATIGATSVMAAASVGHTVFAVRHGYRVLESMVEAVEGKKPSVWHVLTGNLSPVLAKARHHFFHKYGPEAIFETLGAGMSLGFLGHGKVSQGLAFAGMFVAPKLGENIADSNPALQLYDAMVRIQNRGGTLPPDAYAQFLFALTEDTKILDMESHRPEARAKLIMEYAQQNASPDKMLCDVDSGVMKNRLVALDKELAAEEAKADVAAQQEKPVVGKHTGQLANQRNGHSLQAKRNDADGVAPSPSSPPHTAISQVAHAERLAVAPPQAAVGGA